MAVLQFPDNFVISEITATSLTPSFSAVTSSSSYTLMYATDAEFTSPTTVSNFVPGTAITDLTTGTPYYFKVMAVGDGTSFVSSPYGKVISATPTTVTSTTTTTFDAIEATSATLGTISIKAGQLIVCRDLHQLWFDTSTGKRINVTVN